MSNKASTTKTWNKMRQGLVNFINKKEEIFKVTRKLNYYTSLNNRRTHQIAE